MVNAYSSVIDGVNQYWSKTDTASLSITGSLTIAAWIKITTLPPNDGSEKRIVMKGGQSGETNTRSYRFDILQSGGKVYLQGTVNSTGSGSGSGFSREISLSTNVWTHVAFVYDSAAQTGKIFKNGVQQGTTATGLASSIADTTGLFSIGGDNWGGESITGKIDDVLLYNAALSDATVAALYSNPTNPDLTSCVSRWEMETNGNDTVGSNHLTNNGTILFNADPSYYYSSDTQTFNYTGSTQTWTAPAGSIAQVDVYLWGGGGVGGYHSSYNGGGGGAGAYVKSTISSSFPSSANVYIGQGGQTTSGGAGYRTGGNSAGASYGGGGGSSAFEPNVGSTLIAAGGGGGSVYNSSDATLLAGKAATGTSGGAGSTGTGGGYGGGGGAGTNGSGSTAGTGATAATGTGGDGGAGATYSSVGKGGGGSAAGMSGNGNAGVAGSGSTSGGGGHGSGGATDGVNGTGFDSGGGGAGSTTGTAGAGGVPGGGSGGGGSGGSAVGGNGRVIVVTTYTVGLANVKTWNGLAFSSVKSLNQITSSSVKSLNQLT